MSETGQSNTWKLVYIISFPVFFFSGMLGESQLSEVTSNLCFHTSMPSSLLPKNEKYLETSRHVLQVSYGYEIGPLWPFHILKGFRRYWVCLGSYMRQKLRGCSPMELE